MRKKASHRTIIIPNFKDCLDKTIRCAILFSEFMEGLTFDQTPSAPISTPKKRNPRFFYLLGAIVVILILLFGAFKLLGGSSSNNSAQITPAPTDFITETPFPTDTITPTPTDTGTPTPTPTATPKPKANPVDSATGLDRSGLTVLVENGSDVQGAAGKASDYLASLGYNTLPPTNAATQDFTNVTVQVKSTKTNYLSLLKKDLSANYTVGSTSSDLDASSSADALVVIGK